MVSDKNKRFGGDTGIDADFKKVCDFGGDANNCKDCAYYPDYQYDETTGECRVNKWTEAQRSVFEGPLTNSEDR